MDIGLNATIDGKALLFAVAYLDKALPLVFTKTHGYKAGEISLK